MQQETGDYPAGRRSHQQALALFSDRGNRLGHAKALTRLGELPPDAGDKAGPPNRCHPSYRARAAP
jgi:hypothetical protein